MTLAAAEIMLSREEEEEEELFEEEEESSSPEAPCFGHEPGYKYSGQLMDTVSIKESDEREGFYVCPPDYILGHRYQVRSFIGRGTFCLVYLALDLVTQDYVAIKVLKEDQGLMVQEELELNTALSRDMPPGTKLVKLLDTFYHDDHACFVFQLVGHCILSIMNFFDTNFVGIPLRLIKKIVKDTLLGLDYMHKRNMVHTDLKPENIMSSRPLYQHGAHPGDDRSELFNCLEDDPSTVDFLLADLGNSCYVNNPTNDLIQTRQYRSPEVLLGLPYDASADIWSLACMAYELAVRDYLFNPIFDDSQSETDENKDMFDAIHLSLIEDILNVEIPQDWAREGKHYENLYEDGELIKRHNEDLVPGERRIYQQLLSRGLSEWDAAELDAFLSPMLEIIPARRPSAEELLQSPFLHRI